MKQIEIAKKYLGFRELPGNAGFVDKLFEMKLRVLGWKKGQAWCSYFMWLVFIEAIADRKDELNKLFSAGAVKTFDNFKTAGFKITQDPTVGALVIWQKYVNGVPTWQGHAGICIEVLEDGEYVTIEGNTNAMGGREGDRVATKVRKTAIKANGLNIKGFIII